MLQILQEHSRSNGRFQEPQLVTDTLSSTHILPSSAFPCPCALQPLELQHCDDTVQAADMWLCCRYRKEHSRNNGRFQEPQLATDQLSSIHVLPSSTLPDADLEPSELQHFENTAQAADNRTEGGAAALQEPADMVQPGGMTQQPPYSQGLHPDQGLQPGQGFEPGTNGNAEVAQLPAVHQPHVEELNIAGILQPATQVCLPTDSVDAWMLL